MNMYEQFETDTSLERNGIWVDYGNFRVRLARAGGANKKFQMYADQKSKPHRRAMQAGTMPPEKMHDLLYDIYAATVVIDWEVAANRDEADNVTSWERGIHGKDGTILPVTKENVIQTFRNLPDLFLDLNSVAESMAQYRKEELEEEAKNS